MISGSIDYQKLIILVDKMDSSELLTNIICIKTKDIFVKGKKMESIFSLLPKNAQYYFCAPSIPRALAVEELVKIAENHKLNTRAFSSPAIALEAAKQAAKSTDLVYVGGSTFVVAENLS